MDHEGRKPVVLVAEDEPLVRMLAADILEDEGFEVVEAATAVTSWRSWKSARM